MFRGPLLLIGFALIAFTVAAANPSDDPETKFNKQLSVQTAMARARMLLSDKNPQKAVEVLEDQLPKVNGNMEYLVLLREAYRAHIKDLQFAGQAEKAKRYLDRLCILDPNAANDPSLKPLVETPPRKFEPAVQAKTNVFPTFTLPKLSNPFAKKEEPKKAAVSTELPFRGVADDASIEDPFDQKNQREAIVRPKTTLTAQEFLSRGADEFKQQRYSEARVSFEQACQADRNCLEACREQWAYCIIKGVTDALDQPGAKTTELKQQVEYAIGMAPAKFIAVGQDLLQRLDQKAKQQADGPPQVFTSTIRVKHYEGKNPEGWLVAETEHFRIFHNQSNEYAERVAQAAETTRQAMYRKWLGNDGTPWPSICKVILHANAASYTQMNPLVPKNTPGHSNFVCDPSGRVIERQMDLRVDISGMIEVVLPHETTHVVLADMFGSSSAPWADEGMAVLAEPEEKIAQHRRNLLKHHKDEQLFGIKELMEMKEYPHARRIGAFYAQSVVMVEYLTNQRGPKVFADFVKDGLRSGYEASLKRHYNMTFAQLDQTWQQQVVTGIERLAARK